ncbi:hypothetical protein T11_16932 [Trichinella zimbabwensis]|uniref:Uncharacterized protein n=1 Tax=Trichinella zimbabwensis TaxID=268475 RepID=A0A0V1HIZ5_9BILA|nr:hypothetical protein T11_16932 [Trichinella zimbabwensis]
MDLQVQCKVVSAYEGEPKGGAAKREVDLRQHRFRDSRCLLQTGQPVRTCLDMSRLPLSS